MVIVVADSNALMSIFRLSVNLDDVLDRVLPSWELIIPVPTILELERLSTTNKDARAALALVGRFKSHEAEGYADDVVVSVARDLKGVVFSNDREVLQKAKDAGVPRLFFRKKAVLKLDGTL